MTSSVSANYGGYRYESSESRALGGITTESYDYRDQGKTIAKLTGDVSYLAGYMRKMQKGIDSANQNVIQQIQSFINDIIAILAGGGDTGLDFGDLKYILQAFGALFGFDFTNGLVLPINLFDAAWHFFSQYVLGVESFGEAINQFIDNAIAGVLDLFGEIPIVGTALRQLAAIITAIRDAINTTIDAVGQLLWDLWHDPGKVLGQIAQSLVDGLTTALTNIGGAINGVIESVAQLLHDLWTDPGKVLGQIAQSLVDGLTTALTNVGGAINTVVDAVAQLLYDLFNEPSKVIGQIAQDMVIGLSTALTNLGKFINDVIDAVESAFRGIPIVGSGIANMIDGLQGFFNGLFGQPTPAATVKPGAVPSLDAAKITTGSFGSAQISDSAISNAKLGSDISGDKIVAGTVTSARIAALDAAKITTGSFGSSQISDSAISNAKLGSDISGDKIVAGTVVAGRIGSLDAAKITTGSFGSSQISDSAISNAKLGSDISGDKIVAGTVVAGRIGSLDAAKITTGTFGDTQIPSLGAGKITSGTFIDARIPDLATGKITSGQFIDARIPGLDGSKITGGTVSAPRIDTIITETGGGHIASRTQSPQTNFSEMYLGRNSFPAQFFNNVVASTAGGDVKPVRNPDSSGFVAYRFYSPGWYVVSLAFRINATIPNTAGTGSAGSSTTKATIGSNHWWRVAPMITSGNWTTGLTPLAIGSDAAAQYFSPTSGGAGGAGSSWGSYDRYAQGTWIIYVSQTQITTGSGYYIGAGYDATGASTLTASAPYYVFSPGDATGADTYFSIGTISRNYV